MAVPWTWSAAGDVSERWESLTDMMEAPTGPEQRRRLRIDPRIFQQFESLESEARRRRMEQALVANGAGDWDVPFVQDTSLTTAAASIGAMSVSCDTTHRRFFVGSRALIMQDDPRVYEVREIESMASGSLTFTDALDRAWPAGTRVMPIFEGKLASAPPLKRFTGDDVPLMIEFQITEPIDWPEDAGDATYRGLPVLELALDWSTDPETTPERRLAIVDNDTSIPTWYDQPGIPFTGYRMQFTLTSRADIAAFWSLLSALGGRAAPIWVPSHAADLHVTGALVAAATTLDVEHSGLSDWDLLTNRRDIRIELDDGTVLYRRIASVAEISAETERLTLDSALGVDADAPEVVLVSFLALCRQDTDVNLLRWWKHDTVRSEMTFRAYLHEL